MRKLLVLLAGLLPFWAFAQEHVGDYVGEHANGKKNGQGTYIWDCGDKYVGSWVNDSITGKGTYYWHTGEIYVGEWYNDKFNGYGKLTWPDGFTYEGIWKNHVLIEEKKPEVKPDAKVITAAVTSTEPKLETKPDTIAKAKQEQKLEAKVDTATAKNTEAKTSVWPETKSMTVLVTPVEEKKETEKITAAVTPADSDLKPNEKAAEEEKEPEAKAELEEDTEVKASVEQTDIASDYERKDEESAAQDVKAYKIKSSLRGTSFILPAKQIQANEDGLLYMTWEEIIRSSANESDIIKIGLGAVGRKSDVMSMSKHHSHRKSKVKLGLSNNQILEGKALLYDARTDAMKSTSDMAQYIAEIKMVDLIKSGSKDVRKDAFHEHFIIRLLRKNDIVNIKLNGKEFDLRGAGYSKLINEVYNK